MDVALFSVEDVDRERGRVYIQGLKHGNEAFYRLPEEQLDKSPATVKVG